MHVRIDVQGLVGCRARLQRLTDASTATAWVEGFEGTEIDLAGQFSRGVSAGDTFLVEITTLRTTCIATAEATQVGEARTGMEDESSVPVKLEVLSPLRCEPPREAARFAIKGWSATLTRGDGSKVQAFVMDAGEKGVGVVANQALQHSERVHLRIEGDAGTVEAEAEVRYCRSLDRESHRIGLVMKRLGRLDEPLWDRWIKAIGG